MKTSIVGLLAALSLAVLPAAAHATVYTATFNGVIRNGSDTYGDFGAVGGDLTGHDFKAVFTYELRPDDYYLDPDYADGYEGRTVYGANPVSSVYFDIDGTELAIPLDYRGSVDRIFDTNQLDILTLGNDFTQLTLVVNFDALPTFDGKGANWAPNLDSGSLIRYPADFSEAYIVNLTVTSFDITSDAMAGGVPEPASWALMIMGFGLAGATLRRRRAFALS